MVEAEGYRIHNWGGPLTWERFAVPAPGPGEALVEVEACGIGLTVLNTIRGDLANDPALLPRVPGHELVGRVRQLGAGVTGLQERQRVMAYFYLACGTCAACSAGQDSLCHNLAGWVGIHRDGGYASHTVLPAGNLMPVPEGISAIAATAIPDAVATPYHVCQQRARIRPGDRVVVIGAGGGVGIHMVQMARLFGGRVVGLEVAEEKFPEIEAMGATPVLSRSFAGLDVSEQWGTKRPGERPTVVIDLVGTPESLAWGLAALAAGGRMVVLTTFRDVQMSVDPREMVFREIDLLGSRYAAKADLLAAAELVAAGAITPVVSEMTGPDGVEAIHQKLRDGVLTGRGALLWADETGAAPAGRRGVGEKEAAVEEMHR